MKKKSIAQIISAFVFVLLTLAVMWVIFMFSCEDGEQSAEVSENLLSKLIDFFGTFVSHNVLRKIAHFSEFAALGFFMSGSIHFLFGKSKFYIPLIPCVLYAISDEIHQYFVPERACRLFDVFIDSCGSLIGILIFIAFVMIAVKIKSKADN